MRHPHGHERTPFIPGVDQGSTIKPGRRVRNVDTGATGTMVPYAPHCSYGVTVCWDEGYTTYCDTACLTEITEEGT